MMYDHDLVEGSFGNAVLSELTNYPKTIVPDKKDKATIEKRDQFVRREVIGLRDIASNKIDASH